MSKRWSQKFLFNRISGRALALLVALSVSALVSGLALSVKSRLGSRKLLIVNELRHGRSAVGVVIVSLLSFPLAETIPVEAIS